MNYSANIIEKLSRAEICIAEYSQRLYEVQRRNAELEAINLELNRKIVELVSLVMEKNNE